MSGVALQVLRQAAGMSLDEVADAADVSVVYLSRVEVGDVAPTAGWVGHVTSSIGDHIAAKRGAA